jgi:hypothetical protein
MASDPISKKNYTGTFAGGQGPILGMDSSSEPEVKGVHGGEGKGIKSVDEGGHDSKPTGGSENFDLHGKSYAGPDNLANAPENKGVVNPDDVSSSKGV